MSPRFLPLLFVTVVLLYVPNPTCADEVTLIPADGYVTGANVNALAGPLFSSDLDSIDIPGPGGGAAMASLLSNEASHGYAVELDFSGGGFAFFDSAFGDPVGDFKRTATLDHRASAESIFHFAVDVPTSYEVMGFFSVFDDVGTTVPGNVELEIELLEFDTFTPHGPPPATLFYSYQVSKSTMDEEFVVGGMDGDTTNVLDGSEFGLLDPSKFYRYRTLVTINAIDIDGTGPMSPTDGGAAAIGSHTILFSSPPGIPEPAAGLVLLGAAFLASVKRRRSLIATWTVGRM